MTWRPGEETLVADMGRGWVTVLGLGWSLLQFLVVIGGRVGI